MSGLIDRLTDYYSRHGVTATLRRTILEAKRKLFSNRMVVLYCDLRELSERRAKPARSVRIDRMISEAEVNEQDLQIIVGFWNPRQARRNIAERFARGASLWLIKSHDELAGFGWTLRGGTIAPYYFPIGQDDVQFFDFSVFPRFRGRAMHWQLTDHILRTLAAEGVVRAFADTAEWNQAQLSSFKMTKFRSLGLARTFKISSRMITSWSPSTLLQDERRPARQGERTPTRVNSHE